MSPSGVKYHHFSVVLHWSPNDTTSVKPLPYCLEKQILVYAYKNRFLEIFPWPNFFQAYCRSNVIIIKTLQSCLNPLS